MPDRTTHLPNRVGTGFHVLVDGAIVFLAFVMAMKIRTGSWMVLSASNNLALASVISILVYVSAMALSGLYQRASTRMHLEEFLKTAGFITVGGAISLAAMFLIDPAKLPPRSVVAAQCAFTIIGVLGLRAMSRYIRERALSRHMADQKPEEKLELHRLQNRREVEVDKTAVSNYLTGRTVLVTGAGGSVGSVLTDRLVQLNPFRLVLVDVSEFNLFKLESDLRRRRFDGELIFRIADIRDEAIMKATFAAYRPDVVFHAAAYKHVPLMERHPAEAFTNNTLATVSLIRICESFGTEQFIFVSTDKAVEPTSVLGATKRLAEWYIRSIDSEMECKSVRFGNVLNSQGSVVPTFLEQIKRGGPVTITHPDMERFFMSGEEAASLILATLLLEEAPTYAARMGDPIRITRLARFLIEQTASSTKRTSIAFTGLRPGEKLSEKLWSEEEHIVETSNATIVGIKSPAMFSRTELDAHFRSLERIAADNRAPELRKALFESRLAHYSNRAVGE